MANVTVAFASRAARVKGSRASLAGSTMMRSFAPARSHLARRQAARIASDIRCSARTIRRHPKEADVTQAPVHRAACLTPPLTEPPSPLEPQPESRNSLRYSLTDRHSRISMSVCAHVPRLRVRLAAFPARWQKIRLLSHSRRPLRRPRGIKLLAGAARQLFRRVFSLRVQGPQPLPPTAQVILPSCRARQRRAALILGAGRASLRNQGL